MITPVVARYDGEEVHCGKCSRVIGVGIVPTSEDSRVPCKSCGVWVGLPLRQAARSIGG